MIIPSVFGTGLYFVQTVRQSRLQSARTEGLDRLGMPVHSFDWSRDSGDVPRGHECGHVRLQVPSMN